MHFCASTCAHPLYFIIVEGVDSYQEKSKVGTFLGYLSVMAWGTLLAPGQTWKVCHVIAVFAITKVPILLFRRRAGWILVSYITHYVANSGGGVVIIFVNNIAH